MKWLLVLATMLVATPLAAQTSHVIIVSGVTEEGRATPLWLAILRRRGVDPGPHAGVRALDAGERAWEALIASRSPAWVGMTNAVAAPYRGVAGPDTVRVVLGNRGASDAFTHDDRTVGFDLSALVREYGDATSAENADRIDRLFRHEYAHVMQKRWLAVHPYTAHSPFEEALAEMWTEGLGNWHSLSDRWRSRPDGRSSETAAATLAAFEPRLVARLAAIACAPPERARLLVADLSNGPFAEKWGAVAPALWLEAETHASEDALRAFVSAGPDGVLDLARRHLPEGLAAALEETRQVAAMCAGADAGRPGTG